MAIAVHETDFPVGGDAHEFPEVCAAQRHPLNDVVPFGDEIIDRLHEVREGGQDGGWNFLEGLNPFYGRHVWEVQHESTGEELIGWYGILLVRNLLDEAANDRLVILRPHPWPPPGNGRDSTCGASVSGRHAGSLP